MIEVSEIRRRLRATLEQARRSRAERRARAEAAERAYEALLAKVATPVFRMFAAALKAEGHPFAVFTPASQLRLASERSGEDFIEIFLDTDEDPPVVSARISRGRGRRMITSERPVRKASPPSGDLADEDVLEFLLEEIPPFIER
jgi:hypothetical protein